MTSPKSSDKSFLSGHSKGGVWDDAMAPKGEDSWEPIDLGCGVYMLGVGGGNPGGNLGLFTGEEGVVLIDNGLKKAVDMTLATTESLAGGSIDYLINTHLHGDHVQCNPHFAKKGACIVAHENTRRALLADEQFDNSGLPRITFDAKATFHLNGQPLELSHIPKAHTDSDIIVHFPEANVIHAGDLFFNKLFPFVDFTNGGEIDGFIAAQRIVIDLADENTKIIPGHGPLGNKSDMESAVELLLEVQRSVQELVDDGLSEEDVLAANPLRPFEDWAWFHITLERMTKIVYCGLTEQPKL